MWTELRHMAPPSYLQGNLRHIFYIPYYRSANIFCKGSDCKYFNHIISVLYLLPFFTTTTLWWLILCVNLTGLRAARRAGKTPLGVSGKVFVQEVNVWFCKLNKEDGPHQCGRQHMICWQWEWHKKPRRTNSLFLSWAWSLLFSFPLTSQLLVLRLKWNYTISFVGCIAWRWQNVGLLSLYYHMNRFL